MHGEQVSIESTKRAPDAKVLGARVDQMHVEAGADHGQLRGAVVGAVVDV